MSEMLMTMNQSERALFILDLGEEKNCLFKNTLLDSVGEEFVYYVEVNSVSFGKENNDSKYKIKRFILLNRR